MSHWEDAKCSLSTRCYYFKLLFFFLRRSNSLNPSWHTTSSHKTPLIGCFSCWPHFSSILWLGLFPWVFGEFFFKRPGNQINRNTLLSVLDSPWSFLSSRPCPDSRCNNAALPCHHLFYTSKEMRGRGRWEERDQGQSDDFGRGFIWKRS